jgi:hypothetical protein
LPGWRQSETIVRMPHNFDEDLHLDAAGAPLAKGPVDPHSEKMFRIWVWVSQDATTAAARGSMDWGDDPVSPRWECPTTLFQDSPRFSPGSAKGMAIALVKNGNKKKYFGWWDKVTIV